MSNLTPEQTSLLKALINDTSGVATKTEEPKVEEVKEDDTQAEEPKVEEVKEEPKVEEVEEVEEDKPVENSNDNKEEEVEEVKEVVDQISDLELIKRYNAKGINNLDVVLKLVEFQKGKSDDILDVFVALSQMASNGKVVEEKTTEEVEVETQKTKTIFI